MLNSLRIGGTAVLIAMGALTAGCSNMNYATPHVAAATPLSSEMAEYKSAYDNDPRYYAERTYRSKCDDIAEEDQRVGCYAMEREDQLNTEDGRD